MDHPDDFDATSDFTVKDQIAANRKVAKIGADVRPGGAEARLPGEQVAFRLDLIENAIGRGRIVLGDITPRVR